MHSARGLGSTTCPSCSEDSLKLEDKNKLFVEKSSADAAIITDLEHL